MTKKKAKSKPAKTTKAKKSSGKTRKKELNPAEVRKGISRMVESHANKMTKAVIDEGEKGQLATVKYLFEMAAIFPASTDGSQATEDEDCLARTLLNRLDLPTEPVGRDEEEDEAVRTTKSTTASGKDVGEKESDKQSIEKKSSEDATGEEKSHNASLSGTADSGEEAL
jgi:hypothetical protein